MTETSTIKAYVIECENNNFYVGTTDCLTDTWFHHINGIEALWTRRHKPLRVVTVIDEAETHDEFSLIKLYMGRYGIDKVRGGNYKQEYLSDAQVIELQIAIAEDKDSAMNAIAEMCTEMTL